MCLQMTQDHATEWTGPRVAVPPAVFRYTSLTCLAACGKVGRVDVICSGDFLFELFGWFSLREPVVHPHLFKPSLALEGGTPGAPGLAAESPGTCSPANVESSPGTDPQKHSSY